MTAAPGAAPVAESGGLPVGFGILLDVEAREVAPGVWLGGRPARVLRLTGPGAAAFAELQTGPVVTPAGARLARRLVDAGLAHPVPPPLAASPDVTMVVPVFGRPDALDRCLAALGGRWPVVVVDDASPDELGIRATAHRHGAQLVRLRHNAGPGVARDAGLRLVETEYVAFVDSDTIPTGNWPADLAAHLADPVAAAVAPRIRPVAGRRPAARFTATRSSLDLGPRPGSVAPFRRVSYVPSTVLLARVSALRAVARDGAVFDPELRVGEDVDLVWRLAAAGWRVRYQPECEVGHVEPTTWPALLARHHRYGTAAGALGRRHPRAIAPLVLQPWYAAAASALLARRPLIGAGAVAGAFVTTTRTLRRAGVPAGEVPRVVGTGLAQTARSVARCAVQFTVPGLLAGVASRRTRFTALVMLLAPAVTDWLASDRSLDPLRFVVGHLADEVAYGSGVVTGSIRHRTVRPLLPISSRTLRRS